MSWLRLVAPVAILFSLAGCGRSDLFSARRNDGNLGGRGGAVGVAGMDGGAGGVTGGGGQSGGPGGVGGQSGGDAGGMSGGPGGTGAGGAAGTTGGAGGTTGGAGGSAGGAGGTGGTVGGRGGTTGGRGGTTGGRGGTTGGGPGGTGMVDGGPGGTTGGGDGGPGGSTCPGPGRELCTNGRDDDCNDLVDCADPGCFGDRACSQPGQEICNNALDDDDDGRIDCADPDCMGSLACRPTMGEEICNNRVDDNGDRLVDCVDPQCTRFPSCLLVSCMPEVDFGTLATHGADVSRTVDTRGGAPGFATCAPAGGVGRVARFTLTGTADVRLDFTQATGAAHVVSLFRAGASQACDRNPVVCVNAGDDASTTRTFPALGAGVYWVIVQSYPGVPGSTTVRLSTGAVTTPEICANGADDDRNGLVDCQDSACAGHPSCVGQECVPDRNVGALIVDGAARTERVDLRGGPNRYHPTCSGNQPGGDVSIAFTLAEPAGLEVEYQQSAGAEMILAVYGMPAPGLACDADQLRCTIQSQAQNAVAFPGLPAGRYILIVKANGAAREGIATLRLSAFGSRRVEICGNQIDDDNNGLTDCDDPTCFGIGSCASPPCQPEFDLGAFNWGTRRSVAVDTRGGTNLYPSSCARGNGRERVVRVTLNQPMGLIFNCIDGGSHVMELSQQLAPLDLCDEHVVSCVDPATIPFGCNFALPGLQPGQYNLIIQAFGAGDEGTFNLTLVGQQETVREICDNGVDDDNDGAADCNDRKCVTWPACARFSCRPNESLGSLALDGTARSVVVQTTMGEDDQRSLSCVSAPGGQDGVIDFQLPAPADVTLEWAQIGNHVIAIYSDAGPLFACDAGSEVACLPSGNVTSGMRLFPDLPSGRYHVVVDADRPGAEGGVVLQLSATAATMP